MDQKDISDYSDVPFPTDINSIEDVTAFAAEHGLGSAIFSEDDFVDEDYYGRGI